MKVRSALTQSIAGACFAAIFFLIALGLVIAFPNWITCLLVAISAFMLVGDVVNIIHIKRKAAKDSRSLDEQVR
jgi:ABC-type bacteriocin/lantibiotic exporter with double-glycine peptidase domain